MAEDKQREPMTVVNIPNWGVVVAIFFWGVVVGFLVRGAFL